MPAHGEERSRHFETEVFAVGSHTRSVAWKWCAGCGRWVLCDGIVGTLAWMAQHRDHVAHPEVRTC